MRSDFVPNNDILYVAENVISKGLPPLIMVFTEREAYTGWGGSRISCMSIRSWCIMQSSNIRAVIGHITLTTKNFSRIRSFLHL